MAAEDFNAARSSRYFFEEKNNAASQIFPGTDCFLRIPFLLDLLVSSFFDRCVSLSAENARLSKQPGTDARFCLAYKILL